jgi:hypothetical protein
MDNRFTNLDAMVAKLGKTEVHALAEKGLKDRDYRKGRNMRQQAILELVKADKSYAELEAKAKAAIAAKLKR